VTSVATPTQVRLGEVFAFENRFDLCVLLTLLLLLLYSDPSWYVRIPLSVVAICGLAYPAARRLAALWGIAALIIAVGLYTNWYQSDNHKYLLGYWCFALFCAVLTSEPERALATSARWIIALVFLLAIVQKSLSADYLNGTFFHYALLFDERFAGLARWVGGVPEHMRSLNDAARNALVSYDSTLASVHVQGTVGASRLASFLTWWDYLLQTAIAVAFSLPRSHPIGRTRDLWLSIFLFTTYLFAPVVGFGWVLAIMGIAQTERHQNTARVFYVVAFLFLQVYRIPWIKVLGRALDGEPG
jgi:hypothetical protein